MKRGFFNKKDGGIALADTQSSIGEKTEVSESIESLRKQLTEYLHVKNDMGKAEELCSEILNLNPYIPEYLLKRALIRENLGKDVDALHDAALYQYMYPFNLEALSLQARLLEKAGKQDASLKVLQLLMAFDKDDMLKEEYEKVKGMAARSKKKSRKKPRQEGSRMQQAQPRPAAVVSRRPVPAVDESGVVVLEEEKELPKEQKGAELSLFSEIGKAPQSGKGTWSELVENYCASDLELALKVHSCPRCALMADYTRICTHYEVFSEKDVKDLSTLQDKSKSENTFQAPADRNLISIVEAGEPEEHHEDPGSAELET